MGVKSEKVIMAATSPKEIFSMNRDTLETEFEEYREVYGPKAYSHIQNFAILQKITLLYRTAMEMLNSENDSEDTEKDLEKNPPINNYKIVDGIWASSHSTLEGLSKIEDETERKRSTDEYYQLLDRIDLLEDKIIQLGGNLKQIYATAKFKHTKPITFKPDDIWLIAFCCEFKEERIEWFKCAIIDNKEKNLFKMLQNILLDSHLHRVSVGPRQYEVKLVASSKLCQSFDLYLQADYRDEWWLDVTDDKKNTRSIWSFWMHSKADKLRRCDYLDSTKRKIVQRFNNFISAYNSQLMISNLRAIHNILLIEYKKLKITN